MNNLRRQFSEILSKLGLNPLEINIILANFELGAVPASTIAKHISENRVSVYEALNRLSKRGMIKIKTKQNTKVKYFEVENIRTFKAQLEEMQYSFQTAISKFNGIVPELTKLLTIKKGASPEVIFYDGIEGIKNALMDTLEQKPDIILSFASADALENGFNHNFLQDYWTTRTGLKIPSTGILPETEKAKNLFNDEKNQKELRKVKFIPEKYYSFNEEIDIYGNNVSIISFEKNNEHAVIIRSKSIAQALRSIYRLLWSLQFS